MKKLVISLIVLASVVGVFVVAPALKAWGISVGGGPGYYNDGYGRPYGRPYGPGYDHGHRR